MWLVMKAQDPCTGEWCYFVDKCLPFGASISCALFQELSDALNHIFEYLAKVWKCSTNYLDDFLFIAAMKVLCDALVGIFLDMCKRLNIPIALDKTYWGVTRLVFLGILLDGENLTLVVPWEKHVKALALLREFADKCEAKVKDLQSLCGYLNFLCRAFVPGRTFTRRMYSKYSNVLNNRTESGKYLSNFHHVRLDSEFKLDCKTWQWFLETEDPLVVNRPMIDLSESVDSRVLNFYSDASANPGLSFGCIFDKEWIFQQWESDFVASQKPSIEYLELYALCAGVFTWANKLKNIRMILFCDNQSVVEMVNSGVSRCRNCMYLIHLLTLNNLQCNRRVFAQHVRGVSNQLSNSLSHLKIEKFKALALPGVNQWPEKTSSELWPLSKTWLYS